MKMARVCFRSRSDLVSLGRRFNAGLASPLASRRVATIEFARALIQSSLRDGVIMRVCSTGVKTPA